MKSTWTLAKMVVAAGLLAACLAPGVASAHPLGNFTVNHYSRLEPSGDHIRVIYVLDMAEIPTFQEKPRIDPNLELYADQRSEEIRQNLHLSLNGQPAPLDLDHRALSFPQGAGGLPTLRLEAVFSAEAPTNASSTVDLAFRDDNDPNRIGWREIIARPGGAATAIQHSSVPADDLTNELRLYPEDMLSSPLDVREAHLSFVPGAAVADPNWPARNPSPANKTVAALAAIPGIDRTRGVFADLANGADLTPAFILFAIGVASVLGAAHALQPGHGKTIVAAYLVGSRGTAKHALFLGATVTATHTAGVYALGVVTLFLSQYVVPERLYPVLEIVSGLLVLAIGAWLLGQRLLTAIGLRGGHGHSHDHAHAHAHRHADGEMDHHSHSQADSHSHPHAPPVRGRVSWKSLLALGVSGGLLPCPEALMVLLITIAAHRVLFGLVLIVAFSTGLAAVLVGFGLVLVFARGFFGQINLSGGLVPRVLPVASALVIVIAGGVITAQALPQVL